MWSGISRTSTFFKTRSNYVFVFTLVDEERTNPPSICHWSPQEG